MIHEKLRCALCSRFFYNLPSHIAPAHAMNAAEYRRRAGLPADTPLRDPALATQTRWHDAAAAEQLPQRGTRPLGPTEQRIIIHLKTHGATTLADLVGASIATLATIVRRARALEREGWIVRRWSSPFRRYDTYRLASHARYRAVRDAAERRPRRSSPRSGPAPIGRLQYRVLRLLEREGTLRPTEISRSLDRPLRGVSNAIGLLLNHSLIDIAPRVPDSASPNRLDRRARYVAITPTGCAMLTAMHRYQGH